MEKDIDEMLVEYLYYNQKTNIAKVFYFLVYYLEKHQVLSKRMKACSLQL